MLGCSLLTAIIPSSTALAESEGKESQKRKKVFHLNQDIHLPFNAHFI
jgi:hypothetical protein